MQIKQYLAVLQTNGSGVLSFSTISASGKFESQLLHVRDEKAESNNGGTLATGSFVTRTLNTVMTNEITGASLSSNQIILPSGTYFLTARVPAFRVERLKTRLRNITDSTNTLIGTSEHFLPAAEQSGDSKLCGRFTIAAQKTFEVQCRIQTSNNSLDGGVEAGSATGSLTEVYTDVQIWKVA